MWFNRLLFRGFIACCHLLHTGSDTMVHKILNVAEKNDAAKNIAEILSGRHLRRREGLSKYNKIYDFDYMLMGQQCTMVMTSVSGHLLTLEFNGAYRKWENCSPVVLFDAPVETICLPNYEPLKRTLEREIRGCSTLIIWTDCDREGERIGFEIIEVCTKVKQNLRIYRATFSEITQKAITRAIENLGQPNKRISDAVFVRQELDLRIGAAFTRFQTLRFRRVFPELLAESLISYGSCQFPTLGFVVERYKQILDFIPEPFWKLRVLHKFENEEVIFVWKRGRLFSKPECLGLHEMCLENPLATVVDLKSKPKTKWRPLPLDTVELEKLASRKLKINAAETMRIAERLYTQGFISYPRTETNIFPDGLDLRPLVEMQTGDPQWGEFARKVLQDQPNPRKGKKSDQAHPPIHPTKYVDTLQGNDQKVYEFIVRHFLACISKDAEGHETTVEIDVAKERFIATGLMIIAKNYLEVYPYDKWTDKPIPLFKLEDQFIPSKIEMNESDTSPPPLLTEADLIALMEKHGIGTDATHAEHIETIKSRVYVGLQEGRFIPGRLGMGLVEGYDAMGFEMSKPHLRSELEMDLKRICEGKKDPKVVIVEQVNKYKFVFIEAMDQVNKLDGALAKYLEQEAQEYAAPVVDTALCKTIMKCPKCNSDMTLKMHQNGQKFYVGCTNFPNCKHAIWFPESIQNVKIEDETCELCAPRVANKLTFTFKPGSMPFIYTNIYTGCVGGCDERFLEDLGVSAGVSIKNSSTHHPNLNLNSGANHNNITRCNMGSGDFNTSSMPSIPRRPCAQQARVNVNSSNDPNNSVQCDCNEDALLLTVKKDGPNKGRQFYKCAKRDNPCKFYLWASNDESSSNRFGNSSVDSFENSNTSWASHRNSTDTGYTSPQLLPAVLQPRSVQNNIAKDITCTCNQNAILLTVKKDGPNKGRQFYKCKKMPNENPCNFFLWADSNEPANNFNNFSRSNSDHTKPTFSNSHHSNSMRTPMYKQWRGGRGNHHQSTGSTSGRRKCSICRQEGHNKTNCPQNE